MEIEGYSTLFGFGGEEERRTIIRACYKATLIVRNNPNLHNWLKKLAEAGRFLVERGVESAEDMEALLGIITVAKVLEEDARIKARINHTANDNENNGKIITLTAEEREALQQIKGYCARQLEESYEHTAPRYESFLRMCGRMEEGWW